MTQRPLFHLAAAAALAFGIAACGDTGGGEAALSEFRVGITTAETDTGRLQRIENYRAWLEEKAGVPVRIFNASDYNGVAQAMEADQLEMAFVGPSNYANMRLRMGERVDAVLMPSGADYFSAMYVRADSPYQSVDDLAGKTLAFADINSTSGYLVPAFLLRKAGKDPASFFGRTIFGGGHEQAVVAVLQGQADAGVTWSSLRGDAATGYDRGIFRMMVDAGLLDMSQLRVIWQGGPIPAGPIIMRTAVPEAIRERIIAAHLALAEEDPEIFATIVGGEADGYVRVPAGAYDDIIEMRRAEEAARRAR